MKHFIVFSTYVEVILSNLVVIYSHISILHVCEGDPMQDIPNNLKTGILHTCGGDPDSSAVVIESDKYSPHMWR